MSGLGLEKDHDFHDIISQFLNNKIIILTRPITLTVILSDDNAATFARDVTYQVNSTVTIVVSDWKLNDNRSKNKTAKISKLISYLNYQN